MTVNITTLSDYDECPYARYCLLFAVIQNVVMLNVIMLNVVMLINDYKHSALLKAKKKNNLTKTI
jgi:hypothetical protein